MSDERVIHERLIRRAYELARAAAAAGNHPFGALLAVEGEILLEAENTVISGQDATRHAEMNLVSQAGPMVPADLLARATLYTSTEPCAMCAGAIYWAGIDRVVYGCSGEALARIAGGGFVFPCREIFARGDRPVAVIGPILETAGIRIHEAFWPGWLK